MEPRESYRKINLLPSKQSCEHVIFLCNLDGRVYERKVLREQRGTPFISPSEHRRMYMHTGRAYYLPR